MIGGLLILGAVVLTCVVGRLAWRDAKEADRLDALRGRKS